MGTTINNPDDALQRRIAGIGWRLSRHFVCDREDVELRLQLALNYARESYRPDSSLTFEQYAALCLDNCARHLARSMKRRAERHKSDISLATRIDPTGERTFGDITPCRTFGTMRDSFRVIAVRELLDGLKGRAWLVGVALLAGFSRLAIAEKLALPRSTAYRLVDPIVKRIREAVAA